MTLKEFISENNVTGYETVNNELIMNVVVGEICHALDVDTSNIIGGTPLVKFTDFILNGDLLTVDNITININDVNMLRFTEEEESSE